MAQFLLLFLISVHTFVVVLAMANEKARTMVEPNATFFPNPPTPSPGPSKAPVIRKLGKHYPNMVKSFGPFGAPGLSPSQAPNFQSIEETAAMEAKNEEYENVKGQEVHLKVNHHHSMDKSIAGGGVILGGLGATFLVAVFCYIRATGRKNAETNG